MPWIESGRGGCLSRLSSAESCGLLQGDPVTEWIGVSMNELPSGSLAPIHQRHAERPILSGLTADFDAAYVLDGCESDHVGRAVRLNELLTKRAVLEESADLVQSFG